MSDALPIGQGRQRLEHSSRTRGAFVQAIDSVTPDEMSEQATVTAASVASFSVRPDAEAHSIFPRYSTHT